MISSGELLHQRYAKALFETACERKIADKVMEELHLFSNEWLGDKEFHRFLMHPLIDKEEKKILLSRLAYKKGLSDTCLYFFNVLIDNKRENLIHAVYLSYRDLYDDLKRIARVRVEAARPVSGKEKLFIQKRLSLIFGRNIEIETKENPAIISGLKVFYKDTLYDTSILTALGVLEGALSA